MTTTEAFSVRGLTCQHCAMSITEEVGAIAGVDRVDVDLAPGAVSVVTVVSQQPLARADVARAVAEAGYDLVE
jgi:copper chaperone CopZ